VYNLRFPGQYYMAETGLNQNSFRDYDPQIGRYIESDLIGLDGGINTYAYAAANPVSHYDPMGLFRPPITPAEAAVTLDWIAATAIGTWIYNSNADSIQSGIDAALGYWDTIEKQLDFERYHRACDRPPPSGLNPCELAKWR
jgi:RHS repeat-associated protein